MTSFNLLHEADVAGLYRHIPPESSPSSQWFASLVQPKQPEPGFACKTLKTDGLILFCRSSQCDVDERIFCLPISHNLRAGTHIQICDFVQLTPQLYTLFKQLSCTSGPTVRNCRNVDFCRDADWSFISDLVGVARAWLCLTTNNGPPPSKFWALQAKKEKNRRA